MKPVLAFLAVSTAALALASDVSLSGNWKLHTSISGNESDMACALTQKEATLAGKCTSDRGTFDMAGKVDGSKVTMSYKTEYNGTPLTVMYEGTVDEASGMKGSVTVPEFNVAGEFTAVLSK